MDSTTLITLVGTIAAAIGGREAWDYYKKRLDVKVKSRSHGSASEAELRNEIREMLGGQIKELKDQIAQLTDRIKDLENERVLDKKRIANQEIKITLLSERLINKASTIGRKKGLLDDIPTID